ncbi:MAG: hypothetical protein E7639_04500 [Ruminococcaceae bacterium]|nr:hypothetical protein [Oscillospiraceae bacterium]
MEMGKIRFMRIAGEELSREKLRDGIGLLAEKRLHSVLKRWVHDDFSCHEIKIEGTGTRPRKFVADVLLPSGEIYEVQTGKLYPMRTKLAFYMEETTHPVTVLRPLLAVKYVSWLDNETGKVTSRKKSPKKQTPLHALAELKPFLSYIGSPRFSLCLPLLEVDEYRLLDGWGKGGKRGSHRYELIPLALLDTVYLREKADYVALFPTDERLDRPFTAKTFGKVSRLGGYALYDALAVFEALDVIEKCGKEGRAALYRKK